jgi:Trypsin-like peptidase domain
MITAIRLILGLVLAAAVFDNAAARRLIPDDNLAYPVLVTFKIGGKSVPNGSGFYVHKGDDIYLVTAKHVIAPGIPNPDNQNRIEVPELVIELLSYSKDLPKPARIIFSLDMKTLRESGEIKAHQSRDVAAIRIATLTKDSQLNFVRGVTRLEGAGAGIVSAAMETIRTFDQVLVSNEAILYGYPASLGLPKSPQFDPFRPLLRKALIAGEDPQRRTLIIDAPVYRGNSGGPVVEMDVEGPVTHHYVVGVIIQFIPLAESAPDFELHLNSGYSVAEPMDFVLELLGPK